MMEPNQVHAHRSCVICGAPCAGSRCPRHPRRRTSGAHCDQARRALARAAIAAEPWCHHPDCDHVDAGRPGNELVVDHPRHLGDFDGDVAAWGAQPLRPVCHLCACAERRAACLAS